MAALLARAAMNIVLEWTPPPCTERLQLDDWFLGSSQEVYVKLV